MPAREERKYKENVDYIFDGVGFDPQRDLVKMALSGLDPLGANLPANIQSIGGTDQTGADWSAALASVTATDDEWRQRLLGVDDGGDLREAQLEQLDTGVSVGTVAQMTYLARALDSIGEDNLQIDIENASVTTPADIQDSLEKKAENYGADIQSNTAEKVQLDGYSTAEVLVKNITSATDVAVEKSWDDSNWFDVDSATGTADYEETFVNVTAKYLRVTVTGTGGSDTADVVVAGTL